MNRIQIFKIRGMHCAACAQVIGKAVEKQPGVKSAQASYGSETLSLEYVPKEADLEKIKTLLGGMGYTLLDKTTEEEERKAVSQEVADLKRTTLVSFALSLPVIAVAMGASFLKIEIPYANYLSFILTTPVQFGVGYTFYKNSWTALKVKSLSMDVLVALGTSAAYFYSVFGFFFLGLTELFWEASVVVISFIILGRYIEKLEKGRASAAVRKLLDLTPKKVRVLHEGPPATPEPAREDSVSGGRSDPPASSREASRAGGGQGKHEMMVDLGKVKVGDVILIKPGEAIPLDGKIIEGKTSVDEHLVTGESMPVSKKEGDLVIGGTLNQQGLIKVRVEKTGEDTLLSQIIKLVEQAQASRAPIQDLVDKIVEKFVPLVVVISAGAFVFWIIFGAGFTQALLIAVSVLVISCPCAMGLATPAAIMFGTHKASEFGILIKGAEALEGAGKITTVVFDKTGTLTKGEIAVADIIPRAIGPEGGKDEIDPREVLKIAAIAERGSEHPLSGAIVKRAAEEGLAIAEPSDFEALSGLGVKALFERGRILVGSPELMERNGLSWDFLKSDLERLQGEGKTVVLVSYDEKVMGAIALADKIKENAKEAVGALKKMGLEVILLTGDNEKTAKAVGEKVGIERAIWQVMPAEKQEVVRKLQGEGKVVAMVGDGINDAPALATANVGIAIGSGTDVAKETGQIVLIKEDLRDVVTAVHLSRKTLAKIRQNLFWAFFYNILGIPIAAGVLYPFIGILLRPEFAGLAMAFSSVSVVTNSLLLGRYKPKV